MRTTFLLLALVSVMTSAEIITLDPAVTTGTPVAVVYIHGMSCDPESYVRMMKVVQNEAADRGYSMYVALPKFVFETPEPVLIDHYVDQSLKELESNGFTGDNILLAAHSLGGVMSQKYVKKQTNIKGQILMGSVMLRTDRSINDQGETDFSYDVPTLSITGTKDGLLRVSRAAESYWHQYTNIKSDQAGKFPVLTVEGLSHASFMDDTMDLPSFVVKNDLKAEISDDDAHTDIAKGFVDLLDYITKGRAFNGDSTEAILKPLVDAMVYETSYALKDPCYGHELINPSDDPKCAQGSLWSAKAQEMMAGELPQGSKGSVSTIDMYHRVSSVNPVHLPIINNSCDSMEGECALNSYTVSEQQYAALNPMDTGKTVIAATETKVKLQSRQSFQIHAGNTTADFHDFDEVGNRCGEINQASLDWALVHSSAAAKKRYNDLGKKIVIGDDMGPYNAGPLWIGKMLKWEDSDDKLTTTVRSPMMRTPHDYLVPAARDFHYCKLLTPFRAMEWIYIDSLFDRDGINPDSELDELKDSFWNMVLQ